MGNYSSEPIHQDVIAKTDQFTTILPFEYCLEQSCVVFFNYCGYVYTGIIPDLDRKLIEYLAREYLLTVSFGEEEYSLDLLVEHMKFFSSNEDVKSYSRFIEPACQDKSYPHCGNLAWADFFNFTPETETPRVKELVAEVVNLLNEQK